MKILNRKYNENCTKTQPFLQISREFYSFTAQMLKFLLRKIFYNSLKSSKFWYIPLNQIITIIKEKEILKKILVQRKQARDC